MSAEQHDLAERQRRAGGIISQAAKWKVCEVCDAIVPRQKNLCGVCEGYRFDPDPDRVIAAARELGSRAATSVIPSDLT